METIPLDYKRLFPEKGKYGDVPIQRFHISAISGSGEKIPGTFSIKMGGYIPSLDLENFCAVDKKGNNHPQIDLEYYPKGNTVGEIYLRFDFPVEELAGITGRTREEFNSAVHFNNICLLPGMKSEVEMQIENLTNINDPNDMAVSLPDDIKADFLARKASAERRSRGGTSNGPQVSFECRILSIIDKKQVQNFLQEKEITQENPPHLIISDQDMEHLTQLTKAHKKSGFLEGPHFTVFSGEEAEISFARREKRPGFSLKALPIVLEDTNRVNLSFEASEIRTDDSPPQTVTLETEMESGQILLALTPPGFMGQYLQEKDSPDSTILLLIKPSIIPPNTEQSTLTKLEEIFQPF